MALGADRCIRATISGNKLVSLDQDKRMIAVRRNGDLIDINFEDVPAAEKTYYEGGLRDNFDGLFSGRGNRFRSGSVTEFLNVVRARPGSWSSVMQLEKCFQLMDGPGGNVASRTEETPSDCRPIKPTAANTYVFPGGKKLIQQFADVNGVGSFSLPSSLLLDTVQVNGSYSRSVGHRYTTISKLGKSDLCPEDVMNEIRKNPDRVFPIFTATGRRGQALVLHNIYDLDLRFAGYTVHNNPVEVTEINKFSFTFQALPQHTLVGKATHGIIKDQDGVLWMFQEGTGEPGKENFLKKYMNYKGAYELWARMAFDVRDIIRKLEATTQRTGCGCGSSSSVQTKTNLPRSSSQPVASPSPSPAKKTGVKDKMKDIWKKVKPPTR
jgi:hypothetical protein